VLSCLGLSVGALAFKVYVCKDPFLIFVEFCFNGVALPVHFVSRLSTIFD